MLKKFLLVPFFVASAFFCSQLFAQELPIEVGSSNSEIIIDDMLSQVGQDNPTAKLTCNTISTTSTQGQFPLYIPVKDAHSDLPCGRWITYDVVMVGQRYYDGCLPSFQIVFNANPCNGDTSHVRIIGESGSEPVRDGERLTFKPNPNCPITFNIFLTANGFILNPTKESANLQIKITKKIHKCIPTIEVQTLGMGKMSSATTSPNPTTGILNIQFEGVKEGTANIQIYNNIGSMVQENSAIPTYKGENNTQINLENFPAGLYNIAIRQGENIITQRVQKL
jgi:Secretion system C-terminal sorting domain